MQKTQKLLLLTYVLSMVTLLTLTFVYHDGDKNTLTHRVVSISAAAIIMTLLFTVLLLFINNQRLKAANKKLYEKALENLENSKISKQKRELYEQEIKELKQKLSEKGETTRQKYVSSSLDTEAKQRIVNKIAEIMETSNEIYLADFSLARLAELVGSNYKYVSQVINETYHQNFNALLNDYRIKEACLRLNNHEQYNSYTIEAIAESVGFKSRSNFVSTFKRITGITPSEFQRLATS